jgi:hypothetical protein
MMIGIGVIGLLLGCLLGSGVTLVATHFWQQDRHGPAFDHGGRGPGFRPYGR